MLAVYAIVNGNQVGWTTARTLGLLAVAGLLFASFVVHRSGTPGATRAARPLPAAKRLDRQRRRHPVGAAMFAWFFLSALYLQLVLGYSPLQVGLRSCRERDHGRALARAVGETRPALRLRAPLATGCCSRRRPRALRAGTGRRRVRHGCATEHDPARPRRRNGFNPVLLAAMSDVEPTDAGLASGLVNTSFMMGGALGLAVLASLAASTKTGSAGRLGREPGAHGADGGYRLAFLVDGAVRAYGRPAGCRASPAAGRSRASARRRERARAAARGG